ncbi:hypothetical protein [Ferrimonas senticii]|uniref:hypothetical protein n=1 Tax=Ferrimonas senticii TaxID=394566 RepID=UPI00041BEB5E|nr:hypothetical protein [Ferrimonas senticii]
MIARLFLIPIVLCLLWTAYLHINGFALSKGKQGYLYIISFSAAILAFMTLMLWLT